MGGVRRLILDTNVLIALERELRKGRDGRAVGFLSSQPSGHFFVTPTIRGEIACGTSMDQRSVWEEFLNPFDVLPINEQVSWNYGQIYRELASRGELIGTNDLWIAATALAHQQPLVTGNVKEFSRVSGLAIMELA